MSHNELHIGKLELFPRLENESDVDYLKRVLLKLNEKFEEKSWFDDCEENISYYLGEVSSVYEKLFYVEGKFYINVEHKYLADSYVAEIEGNDEDGYTYTMGFYNGGTCLNEMIEEVLSVKINNKK